MTLALVDRRYLISVAVAIGGMAAFFGLMWLAYGDPYLFWSVREPAHHQFSFPLATFYFKDIVGVRRSSLDV